MKRCIMRIFLVINLILIMTCIPARAEENDFIIENGVLSKYRGSGSDVTIPSGVTSIEHEAFCECSSLTSITIPASVTNIEWGAFK